MASLSKVTASRGTQRDYRRDVVRASETAPLAPPGQLEVVEGRVDVAARTQLLGIFGRDGRAVRLVADVAQQLDRLAVRTIARGVRAELVVRRAGDAESEI